MPLSCECSDDSDWFYEPPNDYSKLDTKRCRKCSSCRERILVGALVLKMRCWRYPGYDTIEEKIYGEGSEVPMAYRYLCERCGDLYLSLSELGFCMSIDEDMRDLVRDYAAMQETQRGRARALKSA